MGYGAAALGERGWFRAACRGCKRDTACRGNVVTMLKCPPTASHLLPCPFCCFTPTSSRPFLAPSAPSPPVVRADRATMEGSAQLQSNLNDVLAAMSTTTPPFSSSIRHDSMIVSPVPSKKPRKWAILKHGMLRTAVCIPVLLVLFARTCRRAHAHADAKIYCRHCVCFARKWTCSVRTCRRVLADHTPGPPWHPPNPIGCVTDAQQ